MQTKTSRDRGPSDQSIRVRETPQPGCGDEGAATRNKVAGNFCGGWAGTRDPADATWLTRRTIACACALAQRRWIDRL